MVLVLVLVLVLGLRRMLWGATVRPVAVGLLRLARRQAPAWTTVGLRLRLRRRLQHPR
jgi:hypothetical protein